MSDAIQRAINSSVDQWLQAHPNLFQLVKMLLWGSEHPIISVFVVFIVVAIAFSLIKALGRLMELVGLSILKTPFKLFQLFAEVSFISCGTFGRLVFNPLGFSNKTEPLDLVSNDFVSIDKDKQERLTEITTRLEALQKEQNELLQEVTTILSLKK